MENSVKMSFLKSTLIIIGFYLAAVVAFDIIGILVNSFFYIVATRGKSTLLYYTVWFVAAIFAGLIYYSFAYDYAGKNNLYGKNGWLINLIALALTIVLFSIFYNQHQMEDKDMYYVPGNSAMTYIFFVTFLLASILGNYIEKKPARS